MDNKLRWNGAGLAFALIALSGCTSWHPIRADPDGKNFKGADRANVYCNEANDNCADNKVYASPRNSTQALHNVAVYGDFYADLARTRRINAARWSDTFVASTLVGVLGMAVDSARAVRLGIFGAGTSEIADSRYKFAKQADEFALATKVLRCIEDAAKDSIGADGVTATVKNGKVLVQRQVNVVPPLGGNPAITTMTVQENAPDEDVVINLLPTLRSVLAKVNDRLAERLNALTPVNPSADDLRQAYVRQRDAMKKAESSEEKSGPMQPSTFSALKTRAPTVANQAVKSAVAFPETVEACYSLMK